MALKPDRQVGLTLRHYSMNVLTERGRIVVSDPSDNDNVILPPAVLVGDENPLGIILEDVEDLDFTSRPELLHRNVVASGGAVTIAMTGEYRTNMVASGVTPSAGEIAFLAGLGQLSNVELPGVGSGIQVGRFLSGLDSDGFVFVAIDTVN